MEQQLVNDILSAISDLSILINKNIKSKHNRSDEIKELATALAKAQSEYDTAELNKVNPYFKSRYADFTAVVSASRPALTKNGLSVTQEISNDDTGALWCITELMHTSGQWKLSKFRMLPPKNDIQSISSYNTYVKRMCYASLVGVVTGDEDDDGENAVATSREVYAKGTALNTKYNPKEINPEVITPEQLSELEYELAEDGCKDIAEQVLEGLKIQSLADMPKTKYPVAIRRIREIKQLRLGK
jgi:ERF superfamily protein